MSRTDRLSVIWQFYCYVSNKKTDTATSVLSTWWYCLQLISSSQQVDWKQSCYLLGWKRLPVTGSPRLISATYGGSMKHFMCCFHFAHLDLSRQVLESFILKSFLLSLLLWKPTDFKLLRKKLCSIWLFTVSLLFLLDSAEPGDSEGTSPGCSQWPHK